VVDLELQGKIAAVVDYYQIHEMIDLIVTEEELFEVSEVPEFVNTKDYWTWRCAFRRFTTAHSVKDSDVSRALNRVLLRFSSLQVQGHVVILDGVCRMASGMSWTQAWEKLLEETDSWYLGPSFY
jgi:hypothetical protein